VTPLVLVPLGSPPPEVVKRVAAMLREVYGVDVRPAAGCPDPPQALDPQRDQWSAVTMLRVLLAGARDGERVLGITERDLFVPVLSFVYGQAQLRGRVAVISLARLRPEFHGLRPDAELLAARAVKEAVHEVGHVYGLVHCLDRRCPMALSLGLEDLDHKTATPCPSCAALLGGGSPASDGARPTTGTGGNR
jgi:archaemetzincin